MSDTLRIALAQINLHVGARSGITSPASAVPASRAPPLRRSGWSPRTLRRRLPARGPGAQAGLRGGLRGRHRRTRGRHRRRRPRDDRRRPLAQWCDKLYNCAYLLDGGRLAARRAKHELPNYGVFDEKRNFDAGPAPGPVSFRGFRLGLMICEDWWFPPVAETLAESGAEILLSINGEPLRSR